MSQQPAHAQHQQIFAACDGFGDDLGKRRLARGLNDQIGLLHQFVDGEDWRRVRQAGHKSLRHGAVLIRDAHQHGPRPPAVERTGQRPPNRSHAEDADSQRDVRFAHASSSMRSIARFAFRAISGGTCTRGESVSSESMILSSVIVFMKAQIAFGLTG